MSARDVLRNFFRSRWASSSINLVCLLSWPFYNSKSSKPNGSASLFGRRNKRLLVTSSKLSIPPVQWLQLVLTRALVGAFFLSVKIELDQAAFINDSSTCNALLLSPEYLFTFFWSSVLIISLLNKPKKLKPISSNSCAPTVNTSCAQRLAPFIQLFPQFISYLAAPKSLLESSVFNSNRALRTIFISSQPGLLLRKVPHRLLLFKLLPKVQLGAPILAQAEPQKRLSKLNGIARTPGSHPTLFVAALLYKTIVQQWV